MLIDLVPSLRHTSDDASLLELLPAARKKEWGDKLAFQSFGSKVMSVLSLNQQSPLSVAEIVEGWMLRGGGGDQLPTPIEEASQCSISSATW